PARTHSACSSSLAEEGRWRPWPAWPWPCPPVGCPWSCSALELRPCCRRQMLTPNRFCLLLESRCVSCRHPGLTWHRRHSIPRHEMATGREKGALAGASKPAPPNVKRLREQLDTYMAEQGLRSTGQRRLIVDE